ncbi:protein MTSS 1 isoform X3 [Chiloscyllium punctatum]|uniref:protein MTSS 1 isoform X3 n=1 Tax=Chiloscyllium punctatum TaxID=137246 RepID=UPI003B641C91
MMPVLEEKVLPKDGSLTVPVLIVGNGPSGICLSYLLSGYRPYLSPAVSHPNPILQHKLEENQHLSIVDQDLEYLSEGLEGRSSNPVAVLFDTLLLPDGDYGLDHTSPLCWKLESWQGIPHLVLGTGPPGGSWNAMEGSMLTLSFGSWMELPGLKLKDCVGEKRRNLRNNRVTPAEVAAYYQHFVSEMGLEKNFVPRSCLTSLCRINDVAKSEDASKRGVIQEKAQEEGSGAATRSLWEVRGYQKGSNGVQTPFLILAENVVLATGTQDEPVRLGVEGEELPYVCHSISEFETAIVHSRGGYPVWEDFISKTTKLQSHLRTTIVIAGSFLDAFQKVADLATNTRGATKEIGSALTRMCMRHRSIESRLKQLTAALTDSLINPLEGRIEEWKKIANQLDKDHAKEYKKARQEIKKKSSDTLKLQKKVKKGKEEVRLQLDTALQDVNEKYVLLEETEKQAVCRALIEERSRFCTFVTLLRPVLGEEIGMLGEVTHLQSILEDLTNLTADPQILPPASEQVILDLKVADDYGYTYHTPPSSPSSSHSRRGTVSSIYHYPQSTGKHPSIPNFESASASMETLHIRPPSVSTADGTSQDGAKVAPMELLQTNSLQPKEAASYQMVGENGAQTPLEAGVYTQAMERAQSTGGPVAYKPQIGQMSAREHLALTLSQGMNVDTQRSSRDSLHCSSGYSTQTTTPSCSEDTIPSQAVKKEQSLIVPDYDYLSLHGEQELPDQIDFDKSSTIPRNSDISLNYRKMFQVKRPASTVSLLVDPEPTMTSHVATIRRKPSSKPTFRRGTIGAVPIPIRTPMVPIPGPPVASKPMGLAVSRTGSEECVSLHGGRSSFVQRKQGICSSTQSLSMAQTPGYTLVPEKPLQVSGLQRSAPNLQNARESMPATNNTGNGLTPHLGPAEDSQRTAGVHIAAATPSPTEGGDDVLSMIRRGVKLRKTLTNDRSAPRII